MQIWPSIAVLIYSVQLQDILGSVTFSIHKALGKEISFYIVIHEHLDTKLQLTGGKIEL